MPKRGTIGAAQTLLQSGLVPPLAAVDGLPCAGKSTLVSRLNEGVDFECIYLDEFVLPEKDWPPGIKPAFPFKYIRYDEFLDAVRTLASLGTCSYRPFDWDSFTVSAERRTLNLSKLVVVDGVSSLHPSLCNLYGLRIFVESDRASTLQAALDRGAGAWADYWRYLFLPSADIYMESQPQQRADLLIAGRGT
jgi:uridine kinase